VEHALSLLDVVPELSLKVLQLVLVDLLPLPVLLVVPPLALIVLSAGLGERASSVAVSLGPLALVPVLVLEVIDALPLVEVVPELALVCVSVAVSKLASSVFHVLLELALISVAVGL
jgi:hypothetical protein